jgi:hypothetical protein
MAEQNFKASDIKGFTPSIEPTRSEELFALTGRNYVFDTRGPKSSFGNRYLLPQALGKPEHTQGLRLKLRGGDRCFTFTSDSILEWDESAGGWKIIYITPYTGNGPNRWSWGYLNGLLFFCHPRTGILVYTIETGICQPHSDIGIGTPEEALSIVVNNGFLCVVTPILFGWSAPSNGLDFNPTLGGAGFQLISDRVSGFPLAVSSYTRGCLTWTTGGVMRSEFSGDQAVFRHRALQTEYRPVNSFCTCKIDDDTVVILDERGLFQSKGEAPIPLTPIFNEFFQKYLQENNINLGTNVRIEWDELQRFMYISTSLTESNPLYENCFVLYPNLDKWGQFNEQHYGILPLLVKGSTRADDFYGYVDSDGRVRYWQNTGSREVRVEDSITARGANLAYPPMQKPFGYEDGAAGTILSSSGVANTFVDSSVSGPAGFYTWDGNSAIVLAPERTGLNARIVFGLLRVLGQQSPDQLGEVTAVMIRSLSEDNASVGTGFNIDPNAPASMNLNQTDPAISERFTDENYVNHKLRIIGTVDGESVFTDQTPSLVGFAKSVRYYSCSVIGLWHMMELRADDVGESFHPVTFEVTAIPAGRLN